MAELVVSESEKDFAGVFDVGYEEPVVNEPETILKTYIGHSFGGVCEFGRVRVVFVSISDFVEELIFELEAGVYDPFFGVHDRCDRFCAGVW